MRGPCLGDYNWMCFESCKITRKVPTLLPGGIGIVGLYAFGSDAAVKAAMPSLHRATVEVRVDP